MAVGDPYYNNNLDYSNCFPTVLSRRERLKKKVLENYWVDLLETKPLHFRREEQSSRRINLVIPSINQEDMYGGIATAIKFFERIVDDLGCSARIVVLDAELCVEDVSKRFADYAFVTLDQSSSAPKQVVSAFARDGHSLSVSSKDWFLCTCWWSAYCIQDEISRKRDVSGFVFNPLIYLIQDYEPGFYAWSTRYLLAETTYRSDVRTLAVFNSSELMRYFDKEGYVFEKAFFFEPFLNQILKHHLLQLQGKTVKRRQILVYGRPNTERNAFELVVETLRQWVDIQENCGLWDVVSAGEYHPPVQLGKGQYLTSVGKLSIDDYARILSDSYAGISFMVSPHPSYPPLEMAAFGVRVITNAYSGKDLKDFGDSVISLQNATPMLAAKALMRECNKFSSEAECGNVKDGYLDVIDPFPFAESLEEIIRGNNLENR